MEKTYRLKGVSPINMSTFINIKNVLSQKTLINLTLHNDTIPTQLNESLYNLSSENIRKGIVIGGYVGTCKVYDQETVNEETNTLLFNVFKEDY